MTPSPPRDRRRAGALAVLVLAAWLPGAAAGDDRRPLLVTVDDLPLSSSGLHPDPADRARVTAGLLDVLSRHGIRAVGLVTWRNVRGNGDLELLERWLEAGHELGNHSYNHLGYTRTDAETYVADVEAARRQVAAWNRGDLEVFCADYDDEAVFVSPSGLTRGRQAVLERYRRRYGDRAAQGELAIEVLELSPVDGTEVSMLGDARPGRVHGATVVGRWTLRYPEEASRETASGLMLLVLRRGFDGGWKIVRDASM